ncbi:MAG: hypothetical protein HY858_14160 [Candidatus Solibacter usitatus]|nr:hypothetical protein [Candidatus Solibacter usitatus]
MQLRKMSVLVLCLLLAGAVWGQDNQGYTSVALFKMKMDSMESGVGSLVKFITPVGAKLLKEGTVSGYGVDVDMFHQPGQTNVAVWMDVPSFEAFGKAEDAIHAALKAQPQLTAALWAATDQNAHADIMVRHIFANMKKVPAGKLPYTNFYGVKVKPGQAQEFSAAFEKYQKPLYDKLVADGVIYGYSVDTEVMHSDAAAWVWILFVLPDLGAKDKMLAATRAAGQTRSAAERKAMSDALDAATVPGSHRDSLSQAVVFVTK